MGGIEYLYSVSVHDPSEEWSISEAKTYPVDDIEPIKLTDEILVKNGFDHQMPYNDYAFGEISLYEGGNGYIVNGFVGLGGLSVHIDYVHTLQHLLRLCGVEKELTI